MQLFGTLSRPIVEGVNGEDGLEHTLRTALAELVRQEVGAGAMSAALLKQVIVALLRRSLHSASTWVERFTMLSDPNIARVLAEMAAHPGGPYSVESLAQSACLSRSAFMARFSGLVGQSPMAALRSLRTRQAAQQLAASRFTVDQVARNAGYESRSSFVRAFRKAYGRDPSDYRASPGRSWARLPPAGPSSRPLGAASPRVRSTGPDGSWTAPGLPGPSTPCPAHPRLLSRPVEPSAARPSRRSSMAAHAGDGDGVSRPSSRRRRAARPRS